MRAMPGSPVFLALLILTASVFAQEQYRSHMLVKIMPDTEVQLKALYRASHLDLIEGVTREEPYLAAYPEDLLWLEQHGYAYEVLEDNLEQYYANRLAGAPTLMGGYRTFNEIVSRLDSIHMEHPSITTAKFSIGQSLQGREQWVMKISDNPEVDEDEPEVFYNSLIHAREPAAMMAVLYFMDYLTDNYLTDPDVEFLVDHRELYFLPCVNPDGYVYNQTTNPNGGGMWRKNRRTNGDGSTGIDLNRNFSVAWGIDNDGSSPNGFDETYSGTGPFSEPETQNIRDFVNSRSFVTGIDYHTYSNLVLFPWGTSYYEGTGLTQDNDIFEMVADSMAYWIHSVNNVWYTTGTPWQTLYNTNGGSFDWEYGDTQDHLKIFAVTTEIGGAADGFWPPSNRILPLSQENLPANLFMARIAGALAPRPYAVSYRSQCETEWNGNGNAVIEPGEGFNLTVTLRNVGLQTLTALQGQLSTTDPYVTVAQSSSAWPAMNSNDTGANTTAFQVSIAANCPDLHLIPLSLHMTDAAGLDTTLSLLATVGNYTVVDNVEGGPGGWTTSGANDLWHITTRRSSTPTHSWFCGNEVGDYENGMDAYLTSDTLVLGPGAELSYDQWYDLEQGFDFAQVEINTGAGWTNLVPPVSGTSGGWANVTQSLGLTCPGTVVRVRFHMTSDVGVTAEGWYVDNISTGCPVPSDISVSPVSVQAVAPVGGATSEILQICNLGECPMTWSATFNQITPALVSIVQPVSTDAIILIPDEADLPISKDTPDARRGRDQLDDAGGPDSYGYSWQDSDEPGGPAYNWVELSAVGTDLNFATDDQIVDVTLPWPFLFYGQSYTTMAVSANGNLHFSADTVDYGNRGIPHGRLPNAMLAVWWDDLSPQRAGSSVWVYNDQANGRYIVQWDSVQRFSGGGLYTFEAILYQNGLVNFQYQSMGAVGLTSATIGIENADGSVGLQVVYNAVYVSDNLAIEFTQPWLRFNGAANGTVDPTQCVDLNLDLSAASLPAGTYNGEIIIQSNDPDENPLTVPVTFNVGLAAPESLTLYYMGAADQLSLRWQSTGAPLYKIYSSTSPDGPFETLVTTTASTSALIPAPANLMLFYVVVGSE